MWHNRNGCRPLEIRRKSRTGSEGRFEKDSSLLTSLVAKRINRVWSLGWEDPLEKEMATHSSILAWRIPWTEEPGGLQRMRSQRVGHDWATSHIHTLRLIESNLFQWDFPGGSVVENPPSVQGTWVGELRSHMSWATKPHAHTATTKPVQYLWCVGLVAHVPQVERSPRAITKTQGSQ